MRPLVFTRLRHLKAVVARHGEVSKDHIKYLVPECLKSQRPVLYGRHRKAAVTDEGVRDDLRAPSLLEEICGADHFAMAEGKPDYLPGVSPTLKIFAPTASSTRALRIRKRLGP